MFADVVKRQKLEQQLFHHESTQQNHSISDFCFLIPLLLHFLQQVKKKQFL